MKVFLDSSVIIFALENEKSNSALVLDALLGGEIQGVIDEKVVREIKKYFAKRVGRNYAFLIGAMLAKNCEIVKSEEISEEVRIWRGKIKEKDLEHLAAVKLRRLKHLVAYDEDYKGFEEYVTPREFVKLMKKRAYETEF